MKQTEIELREDMLQLFFYWMNERHAIYLRRQRGDPWPWTADPILQTYKFTNPYRENDKGTVWLREHVIEPYWNHPELFFNIASYRRYNLISTQKALGYITEYNPGYLNQVTVMHNNGKQVFTGAHMLCGNIRDDHGYLPPTKVEQVFGIVFPKLWDKRGEIEPKPGDTLESAFNRFMTSNIPAYGRFIWYEVITDLRHTRYLQNATDVMTWANPGPGARRGIMRLMGLSVKDIEHAPNNHELICIMRALLEMSPEYLAGWMPKLEMRDIEHSACEYDKWMRVRSGEGKPRQKFIPPHLR
jgi:hypothetical protein